MRKNRPITTKLSEVRDAVGRGGVVVVVVVVVGGVGVGGVGVGDGDGDGDGGGAGGFVVLFIVKSVMFDCSCWNHSDPSVDAH